MLDGKGFRCHQEACIALGIDVGVAMEIGKWAARYARDYPNSGLDVNDWGQNLWVALVRALPSYKLDRANHLTFARHIIQNQAISVIRYVKAGKRDCGRVTHIGQDTAAIEHALANGHSNAFPPDYIPTSSKKIEFWADIRIALAPMTSHGRRAVLMLSRSSISEVCQSTNRSRAWVNRNIVKARAYLRAAGIDASYFRESRHRAL